MKKIGMLFCIGIFACIAISCASGPREIIWDESIPPERSSKVQFGAFIFTSFNGININLREGGVATLPSGPAEFGGNIKWWWQAGRVSYYFNYSDAVFSFNLEAGKEYKIVATFELDEESGDRIWGMDIYEQEIRINILRERNKIAFIPFDPPVISN